MELLEKRIIKKLIIGLTKSSLADLTLDLMIWCALGTSQLKSWINLLIEDAQLQKVY